MKKIGLIACLALCATTARSQQFDIKKYDAAMATVLQKAYPASVRMWGLDTSTHKQMSAQFSGVVVSADGYILTAAHTTTPGFTYLVMFPDGKEAIAQALGKIEMAEDRTVPDVSMMKILTPGTWPHAEMGYTTSLKEDEPCVSIAYPESLNQRLPTLRFGRIVTAHNEKGFIQSTCLMEPGDSGGPLFDLLGRVIGIHSAITNGEQYNFEVPVELYRKYYMALREAKKFNSLPEQSEKVDADPQATAIQSWPQLKDLKAAFTQADARLTQYCVWISGGGKKAQGAIFSVGSQTYIVSKSSQVSDAASVFYGKKQLEAKLMARDRETDLVLFQLKTPLKTGIVTTATPVAIGKLLLSPLAERSAVVSVAGSQPFSLPKFYSAGFLGASVPYKQGPMRFSMVRPSSPAGINGLQEGDEVVAMNGVTMQKPEDYGATLQQLWPGDTVLMQLKRGDSAYSSRIVLAEKAQQPPSGHPAESFAGGKSPRRDGFNAVFAHDAILQPEDCGGPVFDTDGNFKGINIARFSRTSSLAIPADEVFRFINEKSAR